MFIPYPCLYPLDPQQAREAALEEEADRLLQAERERLKAAGRRLEYPWLSSRQQRRRRSQEAPFCEDLAPGGGDPLPEVEGRESLRDWLAGAGLTEEERWVVTGTLAGHTVDEIGRALRLSPATVSRRFRTAQGKLQAAAGGERQPARKCYGRSG